jgi:hypothetical protein
VNFVGQIIRGLEAVDCVGRVLHMVPFNPVLNFVGRVEHERVL